MFVLSLYFQSPDTLGLSPLEAGLATLPATVGLVVLAPVVPKLAKRWGSRIVIAAGFALMTVGFAVFVATQSSWPYAAFVLPLVPSRPGWRSPTARARRSRRAPCRWPRSGRRPGSRTWPATSARR